MPVPPRSHPRWRALVEHPKSYAYRFLALKILMQRIARRGGPAMTPADRTSSIDEAHTFFTKNERLVADDITEIFG